MTATVADRSVGRTCSARERRLCGNGIPHEFPAVDYHRIRQRRFKASIIIQTQINNTKDTQKNNQNLQQITHVRRTDNVTGEPTESAEFKDADGSVLPARRIIATTSARRRRLSLTAPAAAN